jgi:hypothetical protein
VLLFFLGGERESEWREREKIERKERKRGKKSEREGESFSLSFLVEVDREGEIDRGEEIDRDRLLLFHQ